MIEIKTYIKKSNAFIEINLLDQQLDDDFYIEGALVFIGNGAVFIDEKMWDCVDQIWGYLVNGLKEIDSGNSFSCYFPDQPVKIEMKIVGKESILFSVDKISGVFDKKEFIKNVSAFAVNFFENLKRISPENSVFCDDRLSIIESLA